MTPDHALDKLGAHVASRALHNLHAMPEITKPSFVIAVPDLQKSAAFYRDVLGFTIHSVGDPGWLFYRCGDCTIMAGECPDAIPPSQLGDHSYFAYLRVADTDSFYETVRKA